MVFDGLLFALSDGHSCRRCVSNDLQLTLRIDPASCRVSAGSTDVQLLAVPATPGSVRV